MPFSEGTPQEAVDEFGASMRVFHPPASGPWPGRRPTTLAGSSPINVPKLLVYGDQDVRAPLSVAEDLHQAIAGSTLVVLPDVGYLCNIEAPDGFNRAVRTFLLERHQAM